MALLPRTGTVPGTLPVSEKAAAILAAAFQVFMEQGYGAASMDAIARVAKVSKATIYSHFAGKQALFAAILSTRCQGLLGAIPVSDVPDAAPAEILTAIGRHFLDTLACGEGLAIYRLVIAESPRFPEIGQIFYRHGPDRICNALAEYLAEQDRLGRLRVADPRLAAEQFFSAALGHMHLRVLLKVAAEPPGAEERARAVAHAVRLFIAGHPPNG